MKIRDTTPATKSLAQGMRGWDFLHVVPETMGRVLKRSLM